MPHGITIQSVTVDHGKALLSQDLLFATNAINAAVVVPRSQFQFDALAIFIYNVGVGAFRLSIVPEELNLSDFAGAAARFALWDRASGHVSAGIIRRRAAECMLFQCGQYTHN